MSAFLHRLTLIILIWCFLCLLAEAKIKLLFDSTAQDEKTFMLNFTWSKAERSGWTFETYSEWKVGINWRVAVVCDVLDEVQSPRGTNWLRSSKITIPEGVERVSINMSFVMRSCAMCKTTFELYYHLGSNDEITAPSPEGPDNGGFTLSGAIAGNRVYERSYSPLDLNKDIKSIPITDPTKRTLYLAFKDTGSCTSILVLKVHYVMCDEIVKNLAWYPEHHTAMEETEIVTVGGDCVTNATLIDSTKPSYACQATGVGTMFSNGCECIIGNEKVDGHEQCFPCKINRYKPTPGSSHCKKCPINSKTTQIGSAKCDCKQGYYRSKTDDVSVQCTKPPGRPVDLKAEVDGDVAYLSWSPPFDDGGREDMTYFIECLNCKQNEKFEPGYENLVESRVTMKQLEPFRDYSIRVYTQNGVTLDSKKTRAYQTLTVKTKMPKKSLSNLPSVRDIRVERDNGLIKLTWKTPDSLIASKYLVHYFETTPGAQMRKQEVDTTFIVFTGLLADTPYTFRVEPFFPAEDSYGPNMELSWNPSSSAAPGKDGGNNNTDRTVLIGVIVSFIILVVLSALVLWCCCCYKHRNCNQKQNKSDLQGFDNYKADESNPESIAPSTYTMPGGKFSVPLIHPSAPHRRLNSNSTWKPYVDPTTYEDPNQAIREFANEIKCEFVRIEAVIGQGEFGEVCRGHVAISDNKKYEVVAIKALKPGSTDKAKADFLTEASIMGQFNHPNVVALKGVVTKTEPAMIITEYMDHHSLDTYLRGNDGKLNSMILLKMLRGVGCGMKYLADIGYVHRDLAARNVLVDLQLTCKIADFGLSRVTEGSVEQAYTTKGGKIPVRWTAPEAIQFRKFTTSSDVWSFGIVMWEVMSYGERPYWDWTNQQVIQAVDQGYRLPPPMGCSNAVHALMQMCWERDRTQRPTFKSILDTIDRFLRFPDSLNGTYSGNNGTLGRRIYHQGGMMMTNPSRENVTEGSVSSATSSLPSYASDPVCSGFNIDQWLLSIQMSQYTANFHASAVTEVSTLLNLTENDLLNVVFVSELSHRKYLMENIVVLRQTITDYHYSHAQSAHRPNGTLPRLPPRNRPPHSSSQQLMGPLPSIPPPAIPTSVVEPQLHLNFDTKAESMFV